MGVATRYNERCRDKLAPVIEVFIVATAALTVLALGEAVGEQFQVLRESDGGEQLHLVTFGLRGCLLLLVVILILILLLVL